MESTKKSCVFITNLIILAAIAVLAILYVATREILMQHDLYYRTWIVVVGDIVAYVLLPIAVFALPITGAMQWRRNRQERGGGTLAVVLASIFVAILAFIYFGVGFVLFIFMAGEEFEKERMFSDGILEGVREESYGFDSYAVYHYYEPIFIFLKKSYEPLSDALKERASEEYGEEFAVCEEDKKTEQQMSLELYTLYSVEHPELVMHMFAGQSPYGISDDYMQAKANWLLAQNEDFMKIAKLPEEVPEEETLNPAERLWSGPRVFIYTEEHSERVAGIVAQAIAQVLEDEAFKAEGSKKAEITLLAWYSNYKREIVIPIADYADESWIEEKLADEFIRYMQNPDLYGGEASAVEETGESDKIEEPDISTPQTIEGAYLCLYKDVFEPQGEPYKYDYNAKENFYAILSDGVGMVAGGEQTRRKGRTVVYDRISQNGKCHLFVYYETFYEEDGTEYETAIRNTYAVDMETGAVTPSGKHAWSDVGTDEYQAATGEK